MPWYRCMLESEDKTVEMTLDVLTDADGVIDSGLQFFGYWRDLDQNDSQPFALAYDGRIDWGSHHTSTFPIRGQRIAAGLRVPYAGYKSVAAFERKEVYYQNDFTLRTYRNYADEGSAFNINI